MKRAAAAVVAMALSQFGTVHAQGNLAIALCKRIQIDSDRLKCFDSLATAKPPDDTPVAMPEVGAWETLEDKSPVDDSLQFSAGLKASGGGGTIIMRCKEKKTDAAVLMDGFINSHDAIRVIYRFDDQKPVEASWSRASTSRAAFVTGAVNFLRGLKDDSKLFVRMYDFQGQAHDATFMLGKISAVRQRVADTCKWPNPQK